MMTQADLLSESMKRNASLSPVTAAYSSEVGKENRATISFEHVAQFEGEASNEPKIHVDNKLDIGVTPLKYFDPDSALNTSKGLRNIIIGGIIFSGIITLALIIQIAIGTTQVPSRIGIITSEQVCSDIGSQMVRKGGKSIDAFIASSLCLSVVNPFSSGLGAGGFLLVRDHKHDENTAYNCFFKTGENLNVNDYLTNPVNGPDSVAMPGEFKCLELVYKKAKFYWKTLAEPAINLAKKGFTVSKNLADQLKKLDLENDIKSNQYMAEVFLDASGNLVKENDIIRNVRLGHTIEQLIRKETDFYEGDIADSLVQQLSKNSKSQLSTADFKKYQASNEISQTSYNDFVLLNAPFPSNGPILSFIIELMHKMSIKATDFKTSEFYTRLLQATDLGYKTSAYIADPANTVMNEIYQKAFNNSKGYFQSLLSGNTSAVYPLNEIPLSSYQLNDELFLNSISVNDHNDMMVSYVGTLGSAWGSRVMTEQGFILNNAMNLFTYSSLGNEVNENNNVGANKQPRGLFTPILTYNSKNPCINRFSISYGHNGHTDDFALTELAEVLLKLFTDSSFYDTIESDKRIQYSYDRESCYETGFDGQIKSEVLKSNLFAEQVNCSFHAIDLVMKKDHLLYCKVDSNRSNDQAVLFNQ